MGQINTRPIKDTTALIREIGERFHNPSLVKSIVLDPLNVNSDPLYDMHPPFWSDLGLASGLPGVILLLSELDKLFPDDKWDEAVHIYVMKIKEVLESSQNVLSPSLFSGLTGICFAIQQASRKGTRYQKFITSLNTVLLDRLNKYYLEPLSAAMRDSKYPSPHLYELIQGASGVGLYCLKNLNDPLFYDLALKIVAVLIALMQPNHHAVEVPKWYVTTENLFSEHYRAAYPKGNFNLGLSHGITGVIAFLSVALENQITAEGHIGAIQQGIDWIQKHRRQHKERFYWPAFVSLDEERDGVHLKSDPGKDAWCYGTPGVARTLYLAGNALQDNSLKQYALESYQSIFLSSPPEWNIPSTTMCHGLAGLLMMTDLMARESSSPFLTEQTSRLEALILDQYDPQYPFGFVDLEPQKRGGYAKIHKAGLLEGATGVLLTLLSTQNPSSSSWRLPFLVCTPQQDLH